MNDMKNLDAVLAQFAELAKITKAHNGLWCAEAEKYLLANAKEI